MPGVNGDIKGSYTASIFNEAYKRGYNVFVFNPTCPGDSNHTNLEVIDFGHNFYMTDAIKKVRELFGADCEIYAIGFSLGGNHIGRHLGSHEDCNKICDIKAFFSVSACYDVPSTTAAMQRTFFGVYDSFITKGLKKPFLQRRYLVQQQFEPHLCKYTAVAKEAETILGFDDTVRSKICNWPGVHSFYRNVS